MSPYAEIFHLPDPCENYLKTSTTANQGDLQEFTKVTAEDTSVDIFPSSQCAAKVGDRQWARIPPGQSVARPEATRAAEPDPPARLQVCPTPYVLWDPDLTTVFGTADDNCQAPSLGRKVVGD
jgi:hypothetical protein